MPSLIELAQMAGSAQGRAAGVEAARERQFRMQVAQKQAEEAAAARGWQGDQVSQERAYNSTRDTLAQQFQALEAEKQRASQAGREREARAFEAQQANLDRQWRSLEAERAQTRAGTASGGGGGGRASGGGNLGSADLEAKLASGSGMDYQALWSQAQRMAQEARTRQVDANRGALMTDFGGTGPGARSQMTNSAPTQDETMRYFNQLLGTLRGTIGPTPVSISPDTSAMDERRMALAERGQEQQGQLTMAEIAAKRDIARTTAGGRLTAAEIAAAQRESDNRTRQLIAEGRNTTTTNVAAANRASRENQSAQELQWKRDYAAARSENDRISVAAKIFAALSSNGETDKFDETLKRIQSTGK